MTFQAQSVGIGPYSRPAFSWDWINTKAPNTAQRYTMDCICFLLGLVFHPEYEVNLCKHLQTGHSAV